MSDLISRSELIKFFKEHIRTAKDFREIIINLIPTIENQPTAYDVDKVVEELERIRAKETCNKEKCDTKEICRICVVDDTIEIVKQCGVSDDVCEWKIFDNSLTEEPQWVYETTCGRYIGEEHTSKAFVYCPYCSKKIKVVE